MFCKNCGTKLMNGVGICHACGRPVNSSPQILTNNNETTKIVEERNDYRPQKEKANYTGIIVIGVVVLIILLIFIAKVLGN